MQFVPETLFEVLLGALALLSLHFVADFLLQTERMATRKSFSIKWLSIHVGTYTLVLGLGLALVLRPGGFVAWQALVVYVLLNGLLHFGTDFLTSKATAYFWRKEQKRLFFMTIGFDQLVHQACLLLTLPLIFPDMLGPTPSL